MLCEHRGEQVASIVSGCGACHRQPVYECAVKGRCAATKQQAEGVAIRACEGCKDSTVPVNCPHRKRGCCEAAARIAGVPLKRCAVEMTECRLCLSESAEPSAWKPTGMVKTVASRGALAYDPGMRR